jgi:hypothetical protein
MGLLPGQPHRQCPLHQYRIALVAWISLKNVLHRQGSWRLRGIQPRPSDSFFRQKHMRPLYLPARISVLNGQVEPDKRIGGRYVARSSSRMLRAVGIDGQLMNEGRVISGKMIGRQFPEQLPAFSGGIISGIGFQFLVREP